MWRRLIPAKSVEDIDLGETLWRPDFELGCRFEDYCKELFRLSLFGIAAYGFLTREIVMHGDNVTMVVRALLARKWLMILGVVLLCVAGTVALLSCKLNSATLDDQITILRLLKRRNADYWSASEREQNESTLAQYRESQVRSLLWARRLRLSAGLLLLAGVGVTALDFVLVLANIIGKPGPGIH